MHLAPLIRDLAIILSVGGAVTFLFQRIKQPVVLGYILAGMVLGPRLKDLPNIKLWGEIGVIFLMFSVGLEFSFRKLARLGVSVVLTAIAEVTLMNFMGYLVGRHLLHWSAIESLFLGAVVSISSTTIIFRAFEELGLKSRRFAEMVLAILVVEDLAAILLLVTLPQLAQAGAFSPWSLLAVAGKLVVIVGSWFILGYFVLPRGVRAAGRLVNEETLIVLSVGLCFLLAAGAAALEYSTALGAFVMGSILAESTESYRIEHWLQPLRTLFSAVFFVSMGVLIEPGTLLTEWKLILILSAVVMGGKILWTTLVAILSGQTVRTAVQVGMALAQIGEFSFIIAGVWAGASAQVGSHGHRVFPVLVSVSLVTTFFTPYLIRNSHRAAVALEKRLPAHWKDTLSRYAAWSHDRRLDPRRRTLFRRLALRWLISLLLVSAIFIVIGEKLDLLTPWIAAPKTRAVMGWSLAILVSSPFLMTLFNLFSRYRTAKDTPGFTLFLSRGATLVWLGILSREFFRAKTAFWITAGISTFFLILFRRQLEASYAWFESQFLETFQPSTKTPRRRDLIRELAPWDAQLVRLKVHPNSDLAGKRLKDVKLRSFHGLNVVAIQRGLKTIVAPEPDQLVFPKDELLVLGSEDRIEKARIPIENPPGLSERYSDLARYEMRPVELGHDSLIAGKTIGESELRERFGGMIVGLERGQSRILNPDPQIRLESGDILWIVGEVDHLDQAANFLTHQEKP